MYIYIYIYVCVCVCVCACVKPILCIYIYIYIHTDIYEQTFTHTHTHIHMCMCMFYIYIYIYIYICIYIYIRMYAALSGLFLHVYLGEARVHTHTSSLNHKYRWTVAFCNAFCIDLMSGIWLERRKKNHSFATDQTPNIRIPRIKYKEERRKKNSGQSMPSVHIYAIRTRKSNKKWKTSG